jgi:hypothetical protein
VSINRTVAYVPSGELGHRDGIGNHGVVGYAVSAFNGDAL